MGITFNPLIQSGFDFTGTGGGGGGVTTVNGLTGAITLAPGSGITITPSGNTLTIASTAGGGSVTSVSVVSANGLAGTVANPTTTPAITLSTTISGILFGNGTSIAAAIAANFPILNQNTTGTASNITASSNSTLTSLPSLVLPTSQLSGSISLTTQVSGILPILNGGTGQSTASAAFNALSPLTTTGDTLYASAPSVNSRLPIGSSGQVYTVVGGLPAWAAPATSGTVTSVGLGLPISVFSVSGSPVTTNGNLIGSFINQPLNTVFAGPFIGPPSAPTFRGLVNSDLSTISSLPALSISAATQLTGTLQAAQFPALTGDVTTSAGSLVTSLVAISNSTLTTLPSLILPGAQVSGNIAGTASNITATSNSTLTSLPSLILPGAQVSGNITGNAANITATSNSTLTSLPNLTTAASLILPTSQLSGTINLATQTSGTIDLTTQVSNILPVPNGGTGSSSLTLNNVILGSGVSPVQFVAPGNVGNVLTDNGTTWISAPSSSGFANPMTTTGDMIYSNPGSSPQRLPIGTVGQVLGSNGTIPVWSNLPGATAFTLAASNQVNTFSGVISGSSFQTFDNSPAFRFTPTISGTYKVYTSAVIEQGTNSVPGTIRVFNTSGGATLLAESQADTNINTSYLATMYVQSVYTLVAGINYQFDIQGSNFGGGGSLQTRGDIAPFYMFCEGVGLQGTLNTTGSSFNIFASSQVTTQSSTTLTGSFQTFNNSPAFTFTPAITGTYKVYTSAGLFANANSETIARIFNTSGGAVLLEESQAMMYGGTAAGGGQSENYFMSVYSLTAGTTYQFDIQGKQVGTGGTLDGSVAPFYMFAEGIGLNNDSCQFPVNMKVNGTGSWSAGNPIVLSSIVYDTNSGYNTSNGQYTVPYSGYYLVGWDGNFTGGFQQVQIYVNGVATPELICNTGSVASAGLSIPLKLNAKDIVTWVAGISFSTNITTQWITSTSLSQGLTGPQGSSSGSTFAFYASNIINTVSSAVSGFSYQTFTNSPAFTFTPTISGIYKVYTSASTFQANVNQEANIRVFNTSGGATLLQESAAEVLNNTGAIISSVYAQSTYSLTAGTTYVFDIQGRNTGGSLFLNDGTLTGSSGFYMFAEGVGLKPINASYGPVTAKFGVNPSTAGNLPTTNGSPIVYPFIYYDTTGSYNSGTGNYVAPVAGYYDVSVSGHSSPANYDIELWVNGINVSGSIVHQAGGAAAGSPCQVHLNYGDSLTVVIDNSSGLDYSVITGTSGITPQVSVTLVPSSIVTLAKMSVYMNTTTSATANTPIVFDTVAFDSAAAYNVGTGIFTAPSPGYYKVGANLNVSSANSDVFVQVNGAAFILLCQIIGSAATSGSTLLQLNQGDTVAIALDTTRNVNGGTAPRNSVFWINQES